MQCGKKWRKLRLFCRYSHQSVSGNQGPVQSNGGFTTHVARAGIYKVVCRGTCHDRGNISDFCFISGTWMDYRYVWRQAAIKDSGSWVIFVRGESRWVHKLCYYQMLLISFGSSFSQCVQNVVWTIELTHALGAGTSFPGVLNLFILI